MKTNLIGVTLTGADDTVDPQGLIDLSMEFPFVEWGILVGSQSGVSRFPSFCWIRRLVDDLNVRGVRLSLHICGAFLCEILDKNTVTLLTEFISEPFAFGRCQMNFHGGKLTDLQQENVVAALPNLFPWTTIIQLDGVNDGVLQKCLDAGVEDVCGLFDRSHGAGMLPDRWPTPRKGWRVGYAGGLGPDNVTEQIGIIDRSAGGVDYWVDMETKLYERGNFSLVRCRQVLEQCKPYIKGD